MKRALKIALVVALWSPVLFFGAKFATGLTSSDFAGWDMGGKATSVQLVFDSPSLGVPATPTGELNLAYSEATFKSGPTGYGLGSVLWPGQVVAALPPFLLGIIEEQAMQDIPLDLPTYPVRAETFYPAGPQDSSFQLGTLVMSSKAHDTFTEANSHLNSFAFPGIIDLGTQTSMTSSGFDTAGAVSMAEAAVSDLSLGALTIDGVTTRVTARSDGTKGTVAGKTTVAGAQVAGFDVVIDNEGVRVAGSEGPGVAAAQLAVNQALAQAGISIELAPPVDTIAGPSASRSLGGVIVTMKSGPLDTVISLLPADIQKQIHDNITFDQTISISIAPAVVSAGAGLKADALEQPPVDTDAIPPAVDTTDTTTPTDVGSGSDTSTDTGTTVPTGPAAVPVSSDFDGVPLWLVVVLLLIALASSRPLVMAADKLFAARGPAGACPQGGT
ncbi:MAG: hypothetical protein WD646_08220 [Actinomycetota bacterium]